MAQRTFQEGVTIGGQAAESQEHARKGLQKRQEGIGVVLESEL